MSESEELGEALPSDQSWRQNSKREEKAEDKNPSGGRHQAE